MHFLEWLALAASAYLPRQTRSSFGYKYEHNAELLRSRRQDLNSISLLELNTEGI